MERRTRLGLPALALFVGALAALVGVRQSSPRVLPGLEEVPAERQAHASPPPIPEPQRGPDDYAPAHSREFVGTRNEATPLLGIGLSQRGGLVGRVIDGKTGEGIPGAVLTTHDNGFEDNLFNEIFKDFLVTNVSSAKVRSAANGSFLIDHLIPGTYQIEIAHPSFATRYVKDLAVQEAKDTSVPDIPVFPGAKLRGIAVDPRGASLAKAVVTVRTTASFRSGLPPLRSTRADAVGRFVVRGLPAGEYVVAVSPGREENSNPFMVIHDWPTRSTVLLGEREEVELRIVVGR